ncbi:hypothetical protein [Virgibacillus salexigens]|uniref:Uncharacterized protein n=1 Tax=Virgibacillus massiliensis TaxID=1462526 RepID=A0A024QGR6_9BACI|nr:hypothetical protein [Virgibacillus massiliensis]CDQ41748.1 hypothetical protein BN990_04125 [Virgibacillus massiliensis]
MITNKIHEIAVSSINYLFLQHVANNGDVCTNDTVEGELYTFFSTINEDYYNNKNNDIIPILSQSIVNELIEGPYLEKYDIDQLKTEIKNSIYIIMGNRFSFIEDIYLDCVSGLEYQCKEKHTI